MLNKRLLSVSKLIKPCDVLMDVGSDHGFLPLYLLKNNIITKAIIGDINSGPLEQAKHNFSNYAFNAIFVKSNGISGYRSKIDAVVIAGMGFETIRSIILQDINRFKEIPQIILQTNTKVDNLRRFLNSNKFTIIDEEIIKDRKYFYPIIKVKYDENSSLLTEKELLYGPILMKNSNEVYIDYLKFMKIIEENILKGQNKESSQRILFINEIIKAK